MKEVFVVLLADSQGNFEWVYTHPKPYYLTKQEAESERQELIKTEPTITLENSKVIKKYLLEEKKNENLKNVNKLN